MKLGMPILFEYDSLIDNVKLAKELGFEFIELNLNFDYCMKELEENKCLYKAFKDNGLEATLHFYDEADFASLDEVVNAYFKLLKKYLKFSKKLNLKTLNVHLNLGPVVTISGVKNYLYEKEYDSYIKRLIKNLNVVKKMCEKYGIELVLENTKMPSFIEKTYLDLKDAGFCFNFDIGHDHMSNDKLKELSKESNFIFKEFHIHDSNLTQDHLKLGKGELDIKYYKSLAKNCYTLLELKSSDDLRESIILFKEL